MKRKTAFWLFPRRSMLALTLCLALGGCMGKPPTPEFLRLGMDDPQLCDEAQQHKKTGCMVLAMKPVTSLPGMDRTAVSVVRGQVMTPSTVWYWEGSPAELLDQAMVRALTCSADIKAVWPYRPRVAHEALLTGRVLAFEVDEAAARVFRIRLRLDLWSPRGNSWLEGRDFVAEAPVAALKGQDIALAAGRAVADVQAQALAWLRGCRALVQKQEQGQDED